MLICAHLCNGRLWRLIFFLGARCLQRRYHGSVEAATCPSLRSRTLRGISFLFPVISCTDYQKKTYHGFQSTNVTYPEHVMTLCHVLKAKEKKCNMRKLCSWNNGLRCFANILNTNKNPNSMSLRFILFIIVWDNAFSLDYILIV